MKENSIQVVKCKNYTEWWPKKMHFLYYYYYYYYSKLFQPLKKTYNSIILKSVKYSSLENMKNAWNIWTSI